MIVRFTYFNKVKPGTSNEPVPVIQVKEILSEDVYLKIIKPIKDHIAELTLKSRVSHKPSKEELENIEKIQDQIGVLQKQLEPYKDKCHPFGPLALSIKDGILRLPENQGGDHEIGIEILEE